MDEGGLKEVWSPTGYRFNHSFGQRMVFTRKCFRETTLRVYLQKPDWSLLIKTSCSEKGNGLDVWEQVMGGTSQPKIPRSYSPLPPLPNSLEWVTFQATDLLTQTNLAVITEPASGRFLYYCSSFLGHSFVIQWIRLSFLMSISSCSTKIVLRHTCVTELDLTAHSLPIGLLIILITYKRAFLK